MGRRLRLAALAICVALCAALPARAPGQFAATPTPMPRATLPPIEATATPRPAGQVVRFSGQLLDVSHGFAFFTTGDGFALDPAVRIVDAATGGPTALRPATRTYARASFDAATGKIVELGLSRRALPPEAAYAEVRRFAVALSPRTQNPDLGGSGPPGITGKPVQVTFYVQVPPRTPLYSDIYLATDVSGWSATAIKMDRIDALHYRVSRDFNSGTHFFYRYTRGSWNAAERGRDGLEGKPHELFVGNGDVRRKDDIVYHWGDEDGLAPDLGNQAMPTPFTGNPFPRPPK
jgi:hypothetical protein